MEKVIGGALVVSAKELAKLLAVSLRHIRRLNSSGRLPAPVRIGGSVRWRLSEIEEWLKAGCPSRQEFETRKEAGKMLTQKEKAAAIALATANLGEDFENIFNIPSYPSQGKKKLKEQIGELLLFFAKSLIRAAGTKLGMAIVRGVAETVF